jgi:hypothetical protein
MWFKVKGSLDLLQNCNFVLFLDADAYFFDHRKPIEHLIDEHMGSGSFLIGTDRVNKDFAFSDSNANSGVFLVRNSKSGLDILTDWWNAPMQGNKVWLWRWPPEQGAFNAIVRLRWGPDVLKVISYIHMNGTDGLFIRHLVAYSNQDRLQLLRGEKNRILQG